MKLGQSKVTAAGHVSIPAQVRERMGIGPGSLISWEEQDGNVLVRRVGRYTFGDLHRKLFPDGPPTHRTDEQLKEGIAEYVTENFARR